MTYFGMPFGMWTLFAPSFRNQLTAVFGYGTNTAKAITKKAKPKYREIISELPEFEKGDAGAPKDGQTDRLLRKIHDDKAHEMVLPNERKEQIHRKGHCRYESYRRAESR